jgi:predicted dehydrogenase
MRVGLVGTGAIADLHARVYRSLGFAVRVCSIVTRERGLAFASRHGAEFVERYEEVCAHPEVDYVDVCTLPGLRLPVVEACAAHGKHVQVQKPMATSLGEARRMIEIAKSADIRLGVVSQHRFDESSIFLARAIAAGRLGRLLQLDAYVKWHRADSYYAKPGKGTWAEEGGGALITQAIHQVDLLRWFGGPVRSVSGAWQRGATHAIESEDVVSAVLQFQSGATGVVQASTAFWPGYPERVEIHGSGGTAIITGDRLTTWDVKDDAGEPPQPHGDVASGASDPMAIQLEPFARQFRDFAEAIKERRRPLVGGEEGLQALAVVDAVYRSCRLGAAVTPEEA